MSGACFVRKLYILVESCYGEHCHQTTKKYLKKKRNGEKTTLRRKKKLKKSRKGSRMKTWKKKERF